MNKGTLYTSYFANWRKYKKISAFLISVTRFPPKYIDFKKEGICHWPILAPSKTLLNAYKEGLISKDNFRKEYLIQISNDTESVKALNTIRDTLDNGTNITLICYERSSEFCHRHIISEIFDEIGYKVEEI